jgi:hypothetical protein
MNVAMTNRQHRRLLRRSEAMGYLGVSSHTFDALSRNGVIQRHVLPGKKQVQYDRQELDRLIESSRISEEAIPVTMPVTMPETMPGKARNFADFIGKLRSTSDATD